MTVKQCQYYHYQNYQVLNRLWYYIVVIYLGYLPVPVTRTWLNLIITLHYYTNTTARNSWQTATVIFVTDLRIVVWNNCLFNCSEDLCQNFCWARPSSRRLQVKQCTKSVQNSAKFETHLNIISLTRCLWASKSKWLKYEHTLACRLLPWTPGPCCRPAPGCVR